MHISLDGFVAGPNGEMNWITINEAIFSHVGKRIRKSNTSMYGRVTYQMMENYWPTAADKPGATRHDIEHAQWYAGAHKIVLSQTMKGASLANTTIISDNIAAQVQQLKATANGNEEEILLFGSPGTTHALMQHQLIDGYWLFVNPIILGKGISLFTGNSDITKLTLLNTHRFECGVTELDYIVAV